LISSAVDSFSGESTLQLREQAGRSASKLC
jgi:hypothetical protein